MSDAKLNNLPEIVHLLPINCLNFYDNLNSDNSTAGDIDRFNVERFSFDLDETETEIAE